MRTRYLKDLPTSVAELRCRLLFIEVTAGRMVVDAVITSRPSGRQQGDGEAAVGSPVTLVTELSNRPWGFAAKATLERWVEQGREVRLRLRRPGSGRCQVEAATDEASMLLDIPV